MNIEITIRKSCELRSEELTELEEWSQREFGHFPYEWAWAALDWHGLAKKGDSLIGCLGILSRSVSVANQSIPIGGVARVITHPKWRRCGVATALLDRAVAFISRDLKCQYALLLCRDEIVPVYTQGGWKEVKGPTRFNQPSGKTIYSGATMVYECREKPWPPGTIDLCGLPF